ncbi:MAG: S-layer homology domain-containing protein, partial [Synechococcaceae cyanobacterium]|nr:S-layer homology domain-containing protein [Synechococcaceae cyanobacterium]
MLRTTIRRSNRWGWAERSWRFVPLATLALALAPLGIVASSRAEEPLPSLREFTDLQPGDWAYQALQDLVERHGCLAGYADGRFQGSRPIRRFEAAALLHACLQRRLAQELALL